jgi:tripeptidyl-peptidase I
LSIHFWGLNLALVMALKSLFVCLTGLLAVASAIPVPDTHAVHEERRTLHPRWTKKDRIESHKLLPMRIGLAQTNLDNVYEHLMDV